jgi:hypothetical protein
MKIVFMVLGFLFLGAAFGYNFATEPESRLAGGVEWQCEPPTDAEENTRCYVTGDDDTFLRLDIVEVTTSLLLGLTGIGCMVASASVGNRKAAPSAAASPQQYQHLQHQQRVGPPPGAPPAH